MNDIQVHMPTAEVSPYAGFWRRVGAALIDAAILVMPYILLAQKTVISGEHASFFALQPTPDSALLLAAIYWAYKAGMEAAPWRATLGKLAMRLRVTDERGRRVSVLRATARSWISWAPMLAAVAGVAGDILGLLALISCIVVAATPRKQGAHDLLARCLVVREGAAFEVTETADGEGTE
jgi:uncharacterized RDD family membrane protein YckC